MEVLEVRLRVKARICVEGDWERMEVMTLPPCWPVAPITRTVRGAIIDVFERLFRVVNDWEDRVKVISY